MTRLSATVGLRGLRAWLTRLASRAGAGPDDTSPTRAATFQERQRDVVRSWTPDRFLATTDLELTDAERACLRDIHDWRFLVPRYIARFDRPQDLTQVYCFGAAHGHTVSELAAAFRFHAMTLPKLHLFDSFEGLPEESPGVPVPPMWVKGAYANALEDFQRRLEPLGLPADGYAVYRGWFKDTLDPTLVEAGVFEPALYVDIDADLYCSTRDALAFMFAHRLIRPGTMIGYDDWGDTDLWLAGESRAHRELMEEYRVRAVQLFSWGEPPLVRTLFRIESVGGGV